MANIIRGRTPRTGFLTVDHRASPGLPKDLARRIGQPSGSGLFEADTLTCRHCKTVQVKNPLRTRPRPLCFLCDSLRGAYICDLCDAARNMPDYQHMPFEKLVDKVQSAPLGTPLDTLLKPK